MLTQTTTGDDLLLVIDTETTGLDVGQHSVIEFGAALYDVNSGTIVTVFSTLIHASQNPAEVINHIPQAALELEVSRRPDLNQIIKMFGLARWVVAHNTSFDRPMVEKLFLDHSVVVASRPWVCSRMQLQFPKATSSRKLVHLAVDHGIEVVGAHRAIAEMSAEEYDTVPKTVTVCEIKVQVEISGFRTEYFVVATTILCTTCTTKQELADLFRQQWHVELDLRAITDTMKMGVLRCKTPTMVRKETWVHLLAYNLLRKIMAEAAFKHRIKPRDISFRGTMQALNAFRFGWIYNPKADGLALYQQMLDKVAALQVANRPGRIEPRERKRRDTRYPIMTKPRAEARAALM